MRREHDRRRQPTKEHRADPACAHKGMFQPRSIDFVERVEDAKAVINPQSVDPDGSSRLGRSLVAREFPVIWRQAPTSVG